MIKGLTNPHFSLPLQCIERGVAVVEAAYLQNRERKPVRPSLRIAISRLLSDAEIQTAYETIETVSKEVLWIIHSLLNQITSHNMFIVVHVRVG